MVPLPFFGMKASTVELMMPFISTAGWAAVDGARNAKAKTINGRGLIVNYYDVVIELSQ
jgi:hypothetical protein